MTAEAPQSTADPIAAAKGARLLRLIATGLVLFVAVYVAIVLFLGFDEVLDGLRQLRWSDWGLLIALSTVHFAFRFTRWKLYLETLGHRVGWVDNLLTYLSGFALTTTPGKVGEVWRAVYLKPHGVGPADVFASFFAERYTDLVAIMLLSCLALGLYQGPLWPVAMVAGVAVGIILVLRLSFIPRMLEARAGSGMIGSALDGAARMLRGSAVLLTPRLTGIALVLALIAWGLHGLMLWIILDLQGHQVGLWVAIGIYAVGLLAGALSFIPGGLGSTEAVMIGLLYLSGIEAQDAATATLICRVATLWFAVAVGFLAMGGLELRRAARASA